MPKPLAIILALAFAYNVHAGEILYALDGTREPTAFYQIGADTGTISTIAILPFPFFSSLAYDPLDDTLYSFNISNRFYKIDRVTGEATAIGSGPAFLGGTGLGFDSTRGRLVMVDEHTMYVVNTANGEKSFLANLSGNIGSFDLAYVPSTDLFYTVHGEVLRSIHPTSGQVNTVVSLDLPPNLGLVTIDYDVTSDRLIAIGTQFDGTFYHTLTYQIDPVSGTGAYLSTLQKSNYLYTGAIAFAPGDSLPPDPEPIPEPGSFALAGLGGLIFFGYRRRYVVRKA